MPVRTTVGPNTTDPFLTTHMVCRVRSTQAVVPLAAHLDCSAALRLPAMRRATSAVVAPARPLAGLMPKRLWNFLIVAQSASDCWPSTVIGPNEPISASHASTCWCLSPCGQPDAGDLAGLAGVEGVDGGCEVELTTAGGGPGEALAPDGSVEAAESSRLA